MKRIFKLTLQIVPQLGKFGYCFFIHRFDLRSFCFIPLFFRQVCMPTVIVEAIERKFVGRSKNLFMNFGDFFVLFNVDSSSFISRAHFDKYVLGHIIALAIFEYPTHGLSEKSRQSRISNVFTKIEIFFLR